MIKFSEILKKRISLLLIIILIVTVCMTNFISKKLMPVVIEYGEYQCENIMTNLLNQTVNDIVIETVKKDIINYNESNKTINFNTEILNSISTATIKKAQFYLYELEYSNVSDENIETLEKEKNVNGMVYKIPLYRISNNALIGMLGREIPIKYQIIGQIQGQIVSVIKEYGINSAFIEVNLDLQTKAKISTPIISEEKNINISVPIVMQIIQGEIPDSFFGSNVIGGVNQ